MDKACRNPLPPEGHVQVEQRKEDCEQNSLPSGQSFLSLLTFGIFHQNLVETGGNSYVARCYSDILYQHRCKQVYTLLSSITSLHTDARGYTQKLREFVRIGKNSALPKSFSRKIYLSQSHFLYHNAKMLTHWLSCDKMKGTQSKKEKGKHDLITSTG